jgi:serine/threonine protein kinase
MLRTAAPNYPPTAFAGILNPLSVFQDQSDSRNRVMMPTSVQHDAFSRVIDLFGEVAKDQKRANPIDHSRLDVLTRKTQTATTKLWRDILQELPFDFSKIEARWAASGGELPDDSIDRVFGWWEKQRDQLVSSERTGSVDLGGFLGILILMLLGLRESERRRSAPANDSDFWNGAGTSKHDCEKTCGALTRDAEVQITIKRVYGRRTDDRRVIDDAAMREASAVWERTSFASARFHRHGTTSIILSVLQDTGSRAMALKLLLAPFQNIDSIVEATARYASDYGLKNAGAQELESSAEHIVRAIASSSSWVLMEFVKGKTLSELLRPQGNAAPGARSPGRQPSRKLGRAVTTAGRDDDPAPEAPAGTTGASVDTTDAADAIDLEQLSRYGDALFAALIEFEKVAALNFENRYHADLSPSNIIVQENGTSGYRFVLIDMGPNYLYTRSIGGAAGTDSIFVAPEVKGGNRDLGLADVYSVGQLLILFAGIRPSADGIVPDVFYADAPLIAQLLEDFLDRNPENRLLATVNPEVGSLFAEMQSAFANELEVAIKVGTGKGLSASRIRPLIGEMLRPFRGEPGHQKAIFKLVNQQTRRHYSTQNRTLRHLYQWSWISAGVSSVTIIVVLWWLFRDMNWDWGNPIIEALNRIVQGNAVDKVDDGFPFIDDLRVGDYDIPDLDNNWLARAVGLSYALLGAKLYQSIFARLSPLMAARHSPELRWSALAAEINMRTVSIVNSALVLSITLVEARFWPIASALGQTYAFVLNYSSERFARKALRVARSKGISTVPDLDSKVTGLAPYSQWVPSSFFYAMFCWTVGIFIYIGYLRDDWLYAATVAAVNVGLFYIIKCGLGGPEIRVGLQRAVLAADRVSLRAQRSHGRLATAQRRSDVLEQQNAGR